MRWIGIPAIRDARDLFFNLSSTFGKRACKKSMGIFWQEDLAGKLGGNVGNEGAGKLDAEDGDGMPSL